MKRCLFVWAFASVAMWGQGRGVIVVPNSLPDADQLQSLEDAFQHGNPLPTGKMIVLPNARVLELPLTAPTTPDARTCAFPLLVVPVNPNIDRKMVIRPHKSAFESADIIKGMPPCSNPTEK
jgi:hypothetical protein